MAVSGVGGGGCVDLSGSREWPPACDSGSDFNGGIVGVGGVVQWRIVVKDGRVVEVMEVVGVEGSRVLVERYRPPHDTVLKRYRVARWCSHITSSVT